MPYLDTSAVLKLYLRELGSQTFRSSIEKYRPWIFTSRVTYAETLAGLARAYREARITTRAYRQKRKLFESDWPAFHIVEVTEDVMQSASRLIEKHGLRGFDSIHLCPALWLDKPEFASFDERLRSAARIEGLLLVPG